MTVTAVDPDLPAQTLTYSIFGVDSAQFTINPTTGALAFLLPHNFEAPNDVGANNVYNLTVQVTDNGPGNLFTTQNLTVTVTNVNETPQITSSNAASIHENTTAVLTVTATEAYSESWHSSQSS